MATMPTKPKTIKIKSMKSVKAPISGKDSIWDGPVENMRIKLTNQRIFHLIR